MSEEAVIFLMFGSFVAAGVVVIIAALRQQTRQREMVHRERLAMIERGLPPEPASSRMTTRSTRMLSGGIVTVGFGLALAVLIGFASGATDIAAGIGGAIAILGAAFILVARVSGGARPEPPAESSPLAPRADTVAPPPAPRDH